MMRREPMGWRRLNRSPRPPTVASGPSWATVNQIMQPQLVLWIYVGLLLLGGAIGYFKAKSRVSLIMSAAFAVALALCAAGVIARVVVADALLAALLLVFVLRLVKTKKFMPAGLMLVLTAVALTLVATQVGAR